MTSPQDVRKQMLIDQLRDHGPATTDELAGRLEMNYHTIYKALRELQEEGIVHLTGRVRSKKYEWAVGTTAVVPEFYDPVANRHIPVDHIVAAYAENRTSASIKAAIAFFETLEQLLNIAQNPEGVTDEQLKKLRYSTIANKSFVKNLSGFYEQLLSTKDFWEIESLAVIGERLQAKSAANAGTNES